MCIRDSHCLENLDLVRISGERVEARHQAVDAVDEEPEVDARSPGDRVPGHRSPLLCRNQPREHAKKCCSGDRCRAIHRYRASAAKNDLLCAEQTLTDGCPKK